MSEIPPKDQLISALKILQWIAAQHEGCHVLAIAIFPDLNSMNPDRDNEIHLAYSGDPEAMERGIIAAAALDEAFNTILSKAFARIKKQEK